MWVEIGTEAAQFLFWEYKNWIFVAVQQLYIIQHNLKWSRIGFWLKMVSTETS
jgi:hypothetical protein